MVTAPLTDERAQRALEARRAEVWSRVARGELAPHEAMGRLDDWLLTIGDEQFLLVPPTGEWLHLDRLHDGWQRTGVSAGEGVLGVHGRLVGTQATNGVRFCPQCGTPAERGDRFCGSCGTGLDASVGR